MTKRNASVTGRSATKKPVRAKPLARASVTAPEIEDLIANSDPTIQARLRRAHDDDENARQIAAIIRDLRSRETTYGIDYIRDVPRLAAYLLDRDNLTGNTWEQGLVDYLRFPARATGTKKTRDYLFVVSDDESIEADSKLNSSDGSWTVSHDCLAHMLVVGYVSRKKHLAGLGLLVARLDYLGRPARENDAWKYKNGQPIGTNNDGKFSTTRYGESNIVWLVPPTKMPEPGTTFVTSNGLLVSRAEFGVLPRNLMPGRELLAFMGETTARDAMYESAALSGMLGSMG